MNVKSSEYIKNVKPLLKNLLDKLLLKYPYASILAEDSTCKMYSISKNNISISVDDILANRGFVVKVFDGKGYSEYSFNEISNDGIDNIVKNIDEQLVNLPNKLSSNINIAKFPKIEEEKIVFSKSTEYRIDPEQLGDEEIINNLKEISKLGCEYDERILDCDVNASYQRYNKLFLSKDKDLEQNIMWMCSSVFVFCTAGEEIKNYFKSYSNLGGAELLDELKQDIEKVASTSLELLDSKPIEPGEYDCICTPEVTGMIVHEAFGHGVEMDMFVKKRALAEQYIDKYVASNLVNMNDGAASANEVATYFFDDEGCLAHDTKVIENGVLKKGICDIQSAMYLNTEPTGNGRRENYKRKAYTRMTNTFFQPGTDKYEDMLSSISYGFLLENANSGMEDPKNWGIQCMVNIAREIKDGKFTGKIFSPIVLTGYVPDLLKSISMVSDDLELGGGGFCGKGYKEWVKVSDGGPYIKARIRLG